MPTDAIGNDELDRAESVKAERFEAAGEHIGKAIIESDGDTVRRPG